MISYEGRVFRRAGGGDGATAIYSQTGPLVWAEVSGGPVLAGALAGRCKEDGVLDLAYALALRSGEVVAGHTINVPELQDDGSVLLREEWRRVGPAGGSGVSYLEEVCGDSQVLSVEAVPR